MPKNLQHITQDTGKGKKIIDHISSNVPPTIIYTVIPNFITKIPANSF